MHLYPDGVWFLDLAPLRDEALVVAEAAQVMGVQQEPDRPLLQSICAHLKSRRTLIVLDNCEHLVKPSAELANAILRAAPHVRMLASSREALHVPGEQSYPLHPLPLPGRDAGLEEVTRSPAVRLFVERAQQHKPSFALDASAGSCRGRTGRAAGRHSARARTRRRARAVTDGGRDQRATQGPLQDPDRRRARAAGTPADASRARRLVLRPADAHRSRRSSPGSASLSAVSTSTAAEQVCGADPLTSDDVLDMLGSLVEKSLVMLDEHDDGGRYRMLETIRDYAREKLEQSGCAASDRSEAL